MNHPVLLLVLPSLLFRMWVRSHAMPTPGTQRMPYKKPSQLLCHPPLPFPCDLEFSPFFPLPWLPFPYTSHNTLSRADSTLLTSFPQGSFFVSSSLKPLTLTFLPSVLESHPFRTPCPFSFVFIGSPLQPHSFKAVLLNLWVVTTLGVKWFFRRNRLKPSENIGIYIKIHNSSKVTAMK